MLFRDNHVLFLFLDTTQQALVNASLTRLTLHRPNSSILEEQPVVHLVPLPGTPGEADLVLGVITVNQVLHYAPGLEEVDGLAIREGIGKCWDAAIGVDGAEPWLFLGVLADVDLVGLVGDSVGY
jgi:hypothetical protein